MKALSAVSIRQYERAVSALESYNRTVELGLQAALRDAPINLFRTQHSAPRQQAAIVFGSDHGMCGRFNEDIAGLAIQQSQAPLTARRVLCVGALPGPHLQQAGQAVETDLPTPGSAAGITTTVQNILLHIDDWRASRSPQEIWLYYNRPGDGSGYQTHCRKLFPLEESSLRQWQSHSWPTRQLPMFTLERETLAAALLKQYFFVTLFRACAESLASEHSNRLAAMQSAERNLEERLEEFNLRYRRSRQEQITDELLDVVSGFEVIGSNP